MISVPDVCLVAAKTDEDWLANWFMIRYSHRVPTSGFWLPDKINCLFYTIRGSGTQLPLVT